MSEILGIVFPALFLSIAASGSVILFYWETRKQSKFKSNWLVVSTGIVLFPIIMFGQLLWGGYSWFNWIAFSISQIFIGVGFFLLYRHEQRKNRLAEGILDLDSNSEDTRSLIDPVTKLPNQRQFETKFKLSFQKNMKEHKPMSLLSVGLDDYRATVISYDQSGADTAIRHVARILEKSIRDFDLLARTNQEGFHLLLEGTESQDAVLIAERIRAKIENTPANWKDQQVHLKCSIGVIIIAENATTPNSPAALIKAADTALLLARQKGGNRVILSSI